MEDPECVLRSDHSDGMEFVLFVFEVYMNFRRDPL